MSIDKKDKKWIGGICSICSSPVSLSQVLFNDDHSLTLSIMPCEICKNKRYAEGFSDACKDIIRHAEDLNQR